MKFDKFASQVSIENIKTHLQEIVKYERLSGSEEELMAFHYLEDVHKSYGAKTELIFHNAYISLPLESSLVVCGESYPCRAPSMSNETEDTGISGEILYFNSINDLTKDKCHNQIVMLNGRATYNNISAAANVGAAAVICVQQDRINECISSNAWGSPSTSTKKYIPDIVSISIDNISFNKIISLCEKKDAVVRVKMDNGWRKIPLLISEIKAPTPTDKFVMFSGHLDSWYYGAMDNGTVNATQCEVLRIASLNKSELKHNIRIVNFSGHSHGRYAGSSWYSDNFWFDLNKNCIININADSLGAINANKISKSMIMPESKDLAIKIIEEQTGVIFEGERCERKADQSFWINGVSSAFASFSRQELAQKTGNDLGWWWHTPDDTLDKIDDENLLRDAKIFTSYIMSFSTASVLPLNYYKTALDIKDVLIAYQSSANERFSLKCAIEKIDEIIDLCDLLYKKPIFDANIFNNFILKIGRILVHLNYTSGNIFENESGVSNGIMPSLKLINMLVSTKINSDIEKEIIVELVQKRNFIEYNLNLVIEYLKEYLITY